MQLHKSSTFPCCFVSFAQPIQLRWSILDPSLFFGSILKVVLLYFLYMAQSLSNLKKLPKCVRLHQAIFSCGLEKRFFLLDYNLRCLLIIEQKRNNKFKFLAIKRLNLFYICIFRNSPMNLPRCSSQSILCLFVCTNIFVYKSDNPNRMFYWKMSKSITIRLMKEKLLFFMTL